MVFPNQKGLKKPKEEDQEQVKDLEGNGFRGKQKPEKLRKSRPVILRPLGLWCQRSKQFGAQPPPGKNISSFVSAENGKSCKVNRPKTSNFVQISTKDSQKTPFFCMISTFEQTHRKRVPIVFSVSSFVSAETAQKTLIEKPRFLKNQLAPKLRIFQTDKGTQFNVQFVTN